MGLENTQSTLATTLGAPGGTAPTFPGGGPAVPGAGTQPDPGDQVKQLIVNILKQSQQGSKTLAQPVPAPIPQARQGEWGDPNNQFQQLMHSISGNIQGAVAQHKQQQLAKAEADWNQLATAMQSGNQPALNAILTDPKKLKLMAKALNQDWLNPEKTDVYREALKKVLAQQQQKGQAAQGLMGLFKHLIGRATQPQLTDQQKQQMAQEIQAKAPVGQAQDAKQLLESARAVADLEKSQADLIRAQAQAREKYQIAPDKDGNLVAVNRSDPTDVIRITDDKGKEVTGQAKGSTAMLGKPALVDGVPVGITGLKNGRGAVIYPGDPEWTGEMAKEFAMATGGAAASQANKEKLARVHQTFWGSLPQAVLMKQDDPQKGLRAGDLAFVSRTEAASKPTMYAPPGPGTKAMGTEARFGEIQRTVDLVNDAITKLPDDAWDTKSRAQLAVVLRASDPSSALSTFLNSEAATTLTEAQVQYVTGLVSMVESAQAMTSLQGIGARGSDRLRATVTAMLPGAATPSRAYAQRQMKVFQTELNALQKGVPGLGPLTGQARGDTAAGPKVGTVEGGYRFKGGDASNPSSWEKVSAGR